MKDRVTYARNRASAHQIARHLAACDAFFVPPLSSRVDIWEYARKIAVNAMRFEAWSDSLVGVAAAYCNDEQRRAAFITSVSVLPDWQHNGIAARLLADCIGHAREAGFARIELEVHAENHGALQMYRDRLFVPQRVVGDALTMTLDLRSTTP